LPSKNCGKNVQKNPAKMSAAESSPQRSEYMRPVIFGNQ
jgi:hypothetical protein